MKIALVHDSLNQFGGAERVLLALHEIYPEAPIFTLVHDKKLNEHFEGCTIVSSPLQHLYKIFGRFQFMLPLIPIALKFFDFSNFDVVISSSSVFVKGIKVPKGVIHINYCHTPARFLWLESDRYIKDEVPAILRPFVKMYFKWMRKWDFAAAQRVDYFVANSENVRNRIKRFYKRDSDVIYPYVDVNFFFPTAEKDDHYLVAGRLHAHKNIDLVIEAFNISGKTLHVAGTGRAKEKLEKMAKYNILFLGRVSDEQLRNEFSSAKGYIFPQEEDFGLMPLEANACGTAVIAYGKGGSLETVIPGKTGVFFEKQNAEGILEAIKRFEMLDFKNEDLFDRAENFSKECFKEKLKKFVEDRYEARN